MEDMIGSSMLKVGRLDVVLSRFETLCTWADAPVELPYMRQKEFLVLCNRSYNKNAKRLRENSPVSECEENELWGWLEKQFGENEEELEALSLLFERSDVLARDRTMDEGYKWVRSDDCAKEMALSIERAEAPMRQLIAEFTEREEVIVQNAQEINRWRSGSLLMKNCPYHMGSAQL